MSSTARLQAIYYNITKMIESMEEMNDLRIRHIEYGVYKAWKIHMLYKFTS